MAVVVAGYDVVYLSTKLHQFQEHVHAFLFCLTKNVMVYDTYNTIQHYNFFAKFDSLSFLKQYFCQYLKMLIDK